MRVAVVWAMLWSAGLAGCLGTAGPTSDEPANQPLFDDETGAIQGQVLDEALTPVPDAVVFLVNSPDATVTDVEGRFVFRDMVPGLYSIRVEKLGYHPIQRALEVRAAEVAAVQVVLQARPSDLPHLTSLFYDGFWNCWVIIAPYVSLVKGECDSIAGADRSYESFRIEPNATGLVAELHWKPSSVATSPDQVWLSIHVLGASYQSVGRSPVRVEMRPNQEPNGNNHYGIFNETSTDLSWDARPNLVTYQQRFRVAITSFYLMDPPTGFSAMPDQ